MANNSLSSVINALKKEVKRQESLKVIYDIMRDNPKALTVGFKNNAQPLDHYNKEIHNELLRAIVVLETHTSEAPKTQPLTKADPRHEMVVKVMQEQYDIHEALEDISKKGILTAGIKVQVCYQHNAMYKKELGEALDYLINESI